MKKVLLLFIVMLSVILTGCGSKLTADKPLSQEGYSKESVYDDDITLGMRFRGEKIVAGTYEGKDRSGKKMRYAAIIPVDLMMRTRKPEMIIIQRSSKSAVYKNGDIYHVFYNDDYMIMGSGRSRTLEQRNLLILDKDKKTATVFVNVKSNGSFDGKVKGELVDFSSKDIFKTLKLQYPFER